MRSAVSLLLGVVLFVCPFLPANACTWLGLSKENVAQELPARISKADTIVHGLVISVGNDGISARIKVLRAFKGEADVLDVESGLLCGHIFQTGDERIYFIREGHVSGPTVYAVWDWLVASLHSAGLAK